MKLVRSSRAARFAARPFFGIAWALVFLCGCCGGGGGFISLTLADMVGLGETSQQLRRYERATVEVRRIEKQGGEEAARRLWEIIEKGVGEHRVAVPYEAIAALGRLGRREDAPRIAQWARDQGPSRSQPVGGSVLTALGAIGGPDACQYFQEFLEAIPTARDRGDVDIVGWAAAVRQAGCLSEEEVRRVLWGFGRDRWTSSYWFHRRVLEVLQGMGEEEAGPLFARYERLTHEAAEQGYPVERARAVLLDTSLPWWVRGSVMNRFKSRPGLKEDLFDTYFAVVSDVYQNKPDLRGAENFFVDHWGWGLVSSKASAWDRTTAAEYLEGKREEFRASMPAEAFAPMNRLIDALQDRQRRWEEQRARDEAREEGKAAGPSPRPAPPRPP